MSRPLSLTILRGPHIADAVPDLVRALEPMDMLFAEAVGGTRAERRALQAWLNAATYHLDRPLEPEAESFLQTSFWGQVALGLRAKGERRRLIKLVDFTAEDGGTNEQQAEAEASTMHDRAAMLIDSICQDPEAHYQLTDDFIAGEARRIAERDELVAKQVTQAITVVVKQSVDPAMAGYGPLNLALVQGYAHRTLELLREQLSGVTVTQQFFAEPLLDMMTAIRLQADLEIAKRSHPDTQLPHKDIDYLIYLRLSQVVQLMSSPSSLLPARSLNNEEAAQLQSTPGAAAWALNPLEIKAKDDFTAEELALEVKTLITQLDAQQSDNPLKDAAV